MLPRFLASALDRASSTARLDADEARHLSQVLRLAAGAEVAVFDGAGAEFRATVQRIARDGADLRLGEELQAAAEPSVAVTLAQAVLKGDRMDEVVRDATMMGAAEIVPLITAHTVAHIKVGPAPERWRRIAIASAKQCRRAVVPAIHPAIAFRDWLAADASTLKILLTEPSPAAAEKRELSPFSPGGKVRLSPFTNSEKGGQPHFSAALAVGPEGGWSEHEAEAALAAGYQPLTLGRRTLRADAAAIVAMSVLQYGWGDL